MTPVKKVRALFRRLLVAGTVGPLQVAPTEVQGTDCPMHSAKIARRDSNARPCSQGYDRRAGDSILAGPISTSDTTDHGARAEQCQLAASCHPRCRSVVWAGERKKNPKSDVIGYARPVRQVCASKARIETMPGRRIGRKKNRRPFAIGRGLRGGRWPGPEVERDGERCYRGRGWVTIGPQ